MHYIYGVGINDMKDTRGISNTREYYLWHDMLKRCYSGKYQQKNPSYKGCTVCTRWLTFSNFLRDLPKEQGYTFWHNNPNKRIALDKDTFIPGNKEYAPGKVCFISQSDNSRESALRNKVSSNPSTVHKMAVSRGHAVRVKYPDGHVEEFFSAVEASRQLTGSSSSMSTIQQTCAGLYPHTKTKGKFKGYTFYWADDPTCPY